MSVVAFKDSIPSGGVNHELVGMLERLLSDAKSGNLRGLAYAATKISDVTQTGWEGSDGSRHPLSTAILILHSRYASALME